MLNQAPPKHRSTLLIAMLLMLLLLTGMACNLLNAAKEPTPTSPAVEKEPTEEVVVEEPTAEPVAEEPTEVPVVETSGTELFSTGEQAIIKDEYYTYGMFTVKNPRSDCAYQNAEYILTAFDVNNNSLDIENGYLDSVLAGGTAVEIIYFPEEAKDLDHFEFTLDAGECTTSQVTFGDITLENTAIFPADTYPQVSAKVVNHLDHYITDVYITAVGYNAANQIIAVGSTYVNVLFPSDYSGAIISMNMSMGESIDHVMMYPTISYFSEFTIDETYYNTVYLDSYIPAVQVDQTTEMVFWMHNDSTDMAATNIQYQATVFDAADRVLAVSTGYIDHVLPGDISPTFITLYLPEGTTADHHFVELTPGGMEAPKFPSNPFTTSNYSIDDSGYYPVVTFDLTNTTSKTIKDLEMVVVLYDVDGNYIGGGSAYAESISGNSTTAQEVYVTISGTPDTADVYIVVDYWTEITE